MHPMPAGLEIMGVGAEADVKIAPKSVAGIYISFMWVRASARTRGRPDEKITLEG